MKKILTIVVLVVFGLLVGLDVTAETNYRVIHEFDGTNGASPYGHLISVDGTLYGMTAGDTVDNKGMVFSITPNGYNYTVLRHFAGQPNDGQWPHGSLFSQGDTLYGITWAGGCDGTMCLNMDETGCGTLFSMLTNGSNYTVFWKFSCGEGDLGAALPNAHFISDGDKLYSTASMGGEFDGGAVFAVQPNGTGVTVLHSFSETSGDDGARPMAGLALEDGVLYGTTSESGDNDMGTVFSIRTNGSDFSVLHHFSGPDGKCSYSTPILADGRIYGATLEGGDYGQGVIFSLRTDGSDYQVLHNFTQDDSCPAEGVILVGDRLYGVTLGTGENDTFGVIYSLRIGGSDYKVLHRFTEQDGFWVDGRLLLIDNTFYGLASRGGNSGYGVIFAFSEYTDDDVICFISTLKHKK